MSTPATIDIVRSDLFTDEAELSDRYDAATVRRVLRIRALYNWQLANPSCKDRQFVETATATYGISRRQAYADLAVIKSLLPALGAASREWHRWKANEMLLETYAMAKEQGDTKTMERAASSYAKYNRVDLEDEQTIPYDEIMVQPFVPTDDPSVLGIKPIPNLDQEIERLKRKYMADNIDIRDVEAEEVDCELEELFPELRPHDGGTGISDE